MLASNAFRAALTILALLGPTQVVVASNVYPTPFYDKPDWEGFTTKPEGRPAAVLRSHVEGHSLVLVTLSSQGITNETEAAHFAYQNLFSNIKHLPAGPLFVVVIVYGSETSIGLYAEYAYVFRRDSTNEWKPRLISEKELGEVECAVGRCFNY